MARGSKQTKTYVIAENSRFTRARLGKKILTQTQVAELSDEEVKQVESLGIEVKQTSSDDDSKQEEGEE